MGSAIQSACKVGCRRRSLTQSAPHPASSQHRGTEQMARAQREWRHMEAQQLTAVKGQRLFGAHIFEGEEGVRRRRVCHPGMQKAGGILQACAFQTPPLSKGLNTGANLAVAPYHGNHSPFAQHLGAACSPRVSQSR
eukprot:1152327-Pelagomonas_calceolata.AAC.1